MAAVTEPEEIQKLKEATQPQQEDPSLFVTRRPSIAPGITPRRRNTSFTKTKSQLSFGYDQFFHPEKASLPLGASSSTFFGSGMHASVTDHTTDTGESSKTQFAFIGDLKITSSLHAVLYRYTESRFFNSFIMMIILCNTVMLVAQTWPIVMVRATWYFAALDAIFLGVYIMEVVLKLYVWRGLYFKESWNILDFSIVAFNVMDFLLPLVLTNIGGFNGAAIFRMLKIFRAVKAIRALRVLRTIRILSNLQVIMATLMNSIRSIGAIVTLIILVMYLFSVIGTGLYQTYDEYHFGNPFKSFLTLFQLLTLDDWFEIYQGIADQGVYHIMLYLLIYIILEYFIFLNLFVAVLVDNFQLSLQTANEVAAEKKRNQVESDDEDDYKPVEADSETTVSSMLSQDKSKIKRRTLEEHYPDMEVKEQENLRHYLQILVSLEYNEMMLNRQQRVLDMMVDLCGHKNEES